MTTPTLAAFTFLLASSSAAFGCMPAQQAPPPGASVAAAPTTSAAPAHAATGERHVYRFDFVLTANDGSNPASTTSFTLNLLEGEKGEMTVGKNVPLSTAPPAPGQSPTARQDVGMKVAAVFRVSGDDVLVDVSTEMSAFEPPSSVRKVVSRGNALVASGKPALVTTLESDGKHYQLTVTPTKLR